MTVLTMPGLKTPKVVNAFDMGRPPAQRQKFSVALSGRTAEIFTEIKAMTDADTDSEVFRNALRLNYILLKSGEKGFTVLMRDNESGEEHKLLLSIDKD